MRSFFHQNSANVSPVSPTPIELEFSTFLSPLCSTVWVKIFPKNFFYYDVDNFLLATHGAKSIVVGNPADPHWPMRRRVRAPITESWTSARMLGKTKTAKVHRRVDCVGWASGAWRHEHSVRSTASGVANTTRTAQASGWLLVTCGNQRMKGDHYMTVKLMGKKGTWSGRYLPRFWAISLKSCSCYLSARKITFLPLILYRGNNIFVLCLSDSLVQVLFLLLIVCSDNVIHWYHPSFEETSKVFRSF